MFVHGPQSTAEYKYTLRINRMTLFSLGPNPNCQRFEAKKLNE